MQLICRRTYRRLSWLWLLLIKDLSRGSRYINILDSDYETILEPRDSVLVPSFKNEIDSAKKSYFTQNPGSYFITEEKHSLMLSKELGL